MVVIEHYANELTADVYGCYVIEDKGYDSNSHRLYLQSNNNIPVIPGRKNRLKQLNMIKKSLNYEGELKISSLY